MVLRIFKKVYDDKLGSWALIWYELDYRYLYFCRWWLAALVDAEAYAKGRKGGIGAQPHKGAAQRLWSGAGR